MTLALIGMSHAQSWCPTGATWTFEYYDQMFGTGVHRINYTGDTLIEGHQAQKLTHWVHCGGGWGQPEFQTYHWSDLYTYEEEGVVYLQGGGSLAFDTVMWFSAVPGDHWSPPESDYWTFVVLDTSTYILDGMPLRQLVVQVEPEGLSPIDTLRERLGFQATYISPSESMVFDGNYGGLRCYEDDAISFVRPWVSDCGYTMSIGQVEKATSTALFPNPGSDYLILALPQGQHLVTLRDATGRIVLRQKSSGEQTLIDTATLPQGTYVVCVDEGALRVSWVKL